jgi:type IV conjugative transfer system coupling protein TraD
MTINRKEKRQEFTRGAEVMRHEFGLYFGALYFSFMIAFIASLGTSIFVFTGMLEDNEGNIFLSRIVAQYNIATDKPMDAVKLTLTKNEKTKVYEVPAIKLMDSTKEEWASIKKKMWFTLFFSLICGIALFKITNWAWRQFGKKVGSDEVVRGAVFIEPDVFRKELKKLGTASDICFAGIPLEKGKEVLNTMISGAIGTGKSVLISEALQAIRLSKSKAILFDPTGEYIERFYREGKDIILNPFDKRSPPWAPWNEIKKPYDFINVAESFIPVMNRKEPFWEEGAQSVLEDLMNRLAKSGEANNRRLVEVINVMTLEEIQEIVKKLPAAVYMDPEAAKTALGIRMNVVRAAKALRYLDAGAPEEQFSIRDWITDGEEDSWLFLSTREDMLATMRPLITAWLDTALRAIMTLPPDRNRLIWNVTDELASLNKINCLKEVITRGRKYGLASILGYQNIAQMREIYGQNDAQTIVSMCQNTLTLRVPDFQTADYISKNLGSQEIYERDENLSYGSDSSRDGVTITTKRGERELVMASEVQGLPDMTGYLRLAGRNDIMRVKFSYKNYPIIANGLEEKEVIGYALDE